MAGRSSQGQLLYNKIVKLIVNRCVSEECFSILPLHLKHHMVTAAAKHLIDCA